ncbi:MAG: glycosyltransferase family 2 protein [Lachnospiraceae bacterium]|nr:glycosyltransferase family 2 protein [Lachnospiraceae bacterium]
MEKLSFVIPCYGSEHTIEDVTNQIKQVMSTHREYDYEIILVNDCSPDNVWQVITRLCKKDGHIRAIRLAKNFGQHSALMAGYSYVTGDYVATLDDDGQTPAEEVFKLVDKVKEGYDVAYGYYSERKDNLFRKFGTVVNNKMLEMMIEKPKNVHLTSYFVAKRYVIAEITKYQNPYPYIWGLVLRTTKNIVNVEINHKERAEGKSGYTLTKLLNLWMNGFTAFSVKPLRFATCVGAVTSAIGVLFIIFTIVKKLMQPDLVPGYSSLMAVLLFIGGMLMVMLGLIGEYVGRIYICINASPQFVIGEQLNLTNQDMVCEEKEVCE